MTEYLHARIAQLEEAVDMLCDFFQQDVNNSAAGKEISSSTLNAARKTAVLDAILGIKDKYKKPKKA
jgi:hypothetical protein